MGLFNVKFKINVKKLQAIKGFKYQMFHFLSLKILI
jgi:hypothetical protein